MTPNLTSDLHQSQSCKRCLYTTDHPLGLVLDDDGICSGCRIHEEKDTLDWDARWDLLKSLTKQYRVSNSATYDCIVPVSGASDSYFIVDTVKNKLGLNPLLVSYNKYFNTPLGIKNLANLRTKFDCDILLQNVNPLSVKKITRTTLRDFGSIYWPCLAGQTVFPVQTAVRYGVPLIIWGAHQGLEQVGMFSHEHEVEMTRRYRKDHDLMGYEADDLLTTFDTLTEDDIWQYRYPSEAELQSVGVRGIYLGNYMRWDPKAQHEKMVKNFDYRSASFARTFDTFDFVDCFNYMGLHDYLKLVKAGYSKVTDHASREIRHGRLSRDVAEALVSKYTFQPTPYVEQFCEWLGIAKGTLNFILDNHRNPKFWEQTSQGYWAFKARSEYNPQSSIPLKGHAEFEATHSLMLDRDENYITVGKGFP